MNSREAKSRESCRDGTDGPSADDVPRRNRTATPPAKNEIPVRLGNRSYRVVLEPGLLSTVGDRLHALLRNPGPVVVVTDRRVHEAHAGPLEASLRRCGWEPRTLLVPPGEGAKTLAGAARLYDALVRVRAERSTPLVAFGGGVIGDLAGFVAATFQRGLPFVQVPTTLLAQVDASVGGKVAVNHERAKNLIGCFHQPAAVFIDPAVLSTLPRRDVAAGLAEVLKCGVIRSRPLFDLVERDAVRLLALDEAPLVKAIAAAVSIKAEIVARDERDLGERALLNYGHTIGHALEALTAYRSFRHGEAVAIGMAAAARIAVESGLLAERDAARQTAVLRSLGLPVHQSECSPRRLRAALFRDKKVAGGRVRFVLPRRIGDAVLVADVTERAVRAGLESICGPGSRAK
ncbi:MAG: 3-dehydroquinate synthase [Planctomycetes bacterium]|nr:3-dehydroquinate synthase [Planctomycetota bacterium]